MSNIPLQSGCQAYDPQIATQYGYVPSLAAGIIFVSLFGISLSMHIAQATWMRMWWAYLFAVGATTEILGWAGRIWSATCPYNNNAFLMQITTLIIAPTFFTAGLYVILGRLIALKGPYSSPISPKLYLWIFCTCDVISLVVQAVGGALASSASSTPTGNTKPGTDIMVAGILFQLASIAVFTVLGVIFLVRVRKVGFERNLQLLVAAMSLSLVTILVRSVYRAIELLQGWTGFLITHEPYFIVLDGAMMVVAVGVFNFFHPAWLLQMRGPECEGGLEMTGPREGDELKDEGLALPTEKDGLEEEEASG